MKQPAVRPFPHSGCRRARDVGSAGSHQTVGRCSSWTIGRPRSIGVAPQTISQIAGHARQVSGGDPYVGCDLESPHRECIAQ